MLADVAASVVAKGDEIAALREQTLVESEPVLAGAAAELRARLDRGGRLLCLGNGGSATDAMDAVADMRFPPGGGRPERALDLTEDTGVITAVANDIGAEAIFARQVIAHGRAEDVLLAQSTSGNSANVVAALAEARGRGLATIAMVGYDGGRIAADELADFVVVVRSEHIPRIQEAQATAWHALRTRLAREPEGRGAVTRRVRARVEGVVQGVGYRPFVYRLAGELGVDGWVLNDSRGVLVEAEGDGAVIDDFVARLASDAPPLASVERVVPEDVDPAGDAGFRILDSGTGAPDALIAADAATCADCLAEVLDPADRRHGYPFANCTNCGPRFTIVTRVPYDRPTTTMAGFRMCAACQAEYDDPDDRRFHAQPNACPDCGPQLSLPLAEVAKALDGGLIVAVKGLGGYHLACRADHEQAAAALRGRKHREDKPFALMTRDLLAAGELVDLTPAEQELMAGRERPIVIARRRADAPVAAGGGPGLAGPGRDAALHAAAPPAAGPGVRAAGHDQRQRLGRADRLPGPGRRRAAEGHRRPVRQPRPPDPHPHRRLGGALHRARAADGAPLARVRARRASPSRCPPPCPVTAYGAELKSTICVAKGGRAWPSHHIGDLENWETLRSFREAVAHFERVFAVDARGPRPRHAPRVPVHQGSAGASRRGPPAGGPAPPRPPGRLPGRARAHRAGARRDL